jgi:hypothetical protein
MSEIALMAHVDAVWPQAFVVHLAADGKRLGVGRDPLRMAAERLVEEGLAHSGSILRMNYVDGRPEVVLSVSDARLVT